MHYIVVVLALFGLVIYFVFIVGVLSFLSFFC